MRFFNLSNILFLGLFVALLSSCQKEPSAFFTASKTTAFVNESISFTNNSIDAESFEWDFGNGQTSTSRNPSHYYSVPGTYNVTLTAYSKNGKKDDSTFLTITIEAEDPCLDVTCFNGGTCFNGLCSCPDGYTGAACETEVAPTKMRITNIIVTRFPATDNGAGWDVTSGPDIYPIVTRNSTTIWDSPTFIQNANPALTYDFTPAPSIEINNPTDQYVISLYDYDDFDADDFMGGVFFTPYTSGNGFPDYIVLDPGGPVAYTIYVSYIW